MTAIPISVPEQFNAATYFVDRNLNEQRRAKLAIQSDSGSLTYQELHDRVNRFGNALRGLGARIEERVFLLLLDVPEFAVSFFGAIKIGAVPVPVNTLLKPNDYKYLLNNSRARVAIVSDSLLSFIQDIPRTELRYLETIVVVGTSVEGAISLDELTRGSSTTLEAART